MTSSYPKAVARLPWLLDALESHLEQRPDSLSLDLGTTRDVCGSRRATADEAIVALEALVDLGVLLRVPGGYAVDRSRLEATRLFRFGVREGIAANPHQESQISLCAALPPGLSPVPQTSLRQSTTDLRSAVLDLLAGARRMIAMASPFWDAATIRDIRPVLSQRLAAGVDVRLLGRFGADVSKETRSALAPLASNPGFQLLTWCEPSNSDPFGTRTFHFKAAVADNGVQAYLGTANFTAASMRSRLEIGVVLKGTVAQSLAEVIEIVFSLAQPAALQLRI